MRRAYNGIDLMTGKHLRDLCPKEWFTEENMKVSPNAAYINITELDKELLYTMGNRNDYPAIAQDIIQSNHHPFDNVVYTTDISSHHVLCEVINNLTSEKRYCIMRVVVDDEHMGVSAVERFAGNDPDIQIAYYREDNIELLSKLCYRLARLNILIGYYALSCHRNNISRKVGSVARDKQNKEKPRRSMTGTILIKDFPLLNLSTYIEGKGSKPTHEFCVRGHIRRYKSGKEVFIKSYVKCKGRGVVRPQAYKLSQSD